MKSSSENTSNQRSHKATSSHDHPRRIWAVVVSVICLLLLVLTIGFLGYASDYYRDLDKNGENLVSTEEIGVVHGNNYYAFGNPSAHKALIFYPGAKVEYTAYAPLMRSLAEQGYLAIIAEMPFNLAILDINAANGIRKDFPQVEQWWVGGHSLGGAMASQYASENAADLTGLVLLGAYTATDLSHTSLKVCMLYGSEDGVIDRNKLLQSVSLLPSSSSIKVIEGGNHAFFGNYGAQAGDGETSLSPQEQWEITADIIGACMRSATSE